MKMIQMLFFEKELLLILLLESSINEYGFWKIISCNILFIIKKNTQEKKRQRYDITKKKSN
jgi:hypothetical protein